VFRSLELLNLSAGSPKFLSFEQGFGVSGEARVNYYAIKNRIGEKNPLIAFKSERTEPFIRGYNKKFRTPQIRERKTHLNDRRNENFRA
jgi:hypothetical protein